MTAETDADAGEDEHIKALYAEVDTNKDGKVLSAVLRCDCHVVLLFGLNFAGWLVLWELGVIRPLRVLWCAARCPQHLRRSALRSTSVKTTLLLPALRTPNRPLPEFE